MKKLLFILALIMPFMANAMKIEKNEIDEFTGEQTIITSWEHFQQRSINIRFRLQGGKQYLDFKYITNSSFVVQEEGFLMFKAEDGDITKFSSIRLFAGGVGEGAVGINGSGAWGIYAIYVGDISWFTTHISQFMRVYSTDGYIDKKMSEKEGKKLQDLANLFISTVNK